MNNKKRRSTPVGIAAAAAVILFLFSGIGIGFGSGAGSGNNSIAANADAVPDSTPPAQPVPTPAETAVASPTPEIGTTEKATVSVSVVKNEYFYQNRSTSIDALLELLLSFEAGCIVEIVDDNASLKAYNTLIDALNEHDIAYTELLS